MCATRTSRTGYFESPRLYAATPASGRCGRWASARSSRATSSAGTSASLAGGFGGLLIATVIIILMYVGLCDAIAEMSPALPHAGGAYSFGRSAMGPWGGFITGLAENMEYVLTPAVIVVGIGGYLGSGLRDPGGVRARAGG